MRIYDIIMKKRNGHELTKEEIQFVVDGYTKGTIPDYQVSALLMAIFFRGMTSKETAELTMSMARSGDMVDLSDIKGIKVDKHSTGGVGDKTTLVIAPIVAACGVPVAKMSGRGLGHTGGTIDKMEAIPGMQTALPREEFFDIVNKVGVSVIGQSGNLAPADKKLYALRDVTATVDNVSLIAASIMSKKIAAGSDCILLDVKTGSGAFMKTLDDSIRLAEEMVSIGESVGRRTIAMITDMDRPLGFNIGNSLEVIEAIDTLKGHGPEDLTDICITLASNMLFLAQKGTLEECETLVKEAIASGAAFNKLKEMVVAQGGDVSVIEDTNNFAKASVVHEMKATQSGYISHMQTEECGIAAMLLGAGRETVDSQIDYAAGIILKAKIGDEVKEGDTLALLLTSEEGRIQKAESTLREAIIIADEKPVINPLVHARISIEGVERF